MVKSTWGEGKPGGANGVKGHQRRWWRGFGIITCNTTRRLAVGHGGDGVGGGLWQRRRRSLRVGIRIAGARDRFARKWSLVVIVAVVMIKEIVLALDQMIVSIRGNGDLNM